MTFGQTSGPPATAAQLTELSELFEQVGFETFREARHPYGLSQRQSNGKFTRTEADELLDRLRDEVDGSGPAEVDRLADVASEVGGALSVDDTPPAVDDVVLAFPDEVLAEELRRRGWACIPPDSRELS
jgi:hypothetical protein